jgi:superfamily II DNA helicase RecQ
MYHSGTSSRLKKAIENDLRDPYGAVRLVVVSAALGRGANFPGIQKVIFLKAPLSLEELWQAAGRAGRRAPGQEFSETAVITVFYRMLDVPKGRAAESLRRWLQLASGADLGAFRQESCRRAMAAEYFAFAGDPPTVLPDAHVCCDQCRSLCSCGACPALALFPRAAVIGPLPRPC